MSDAMASRFELQAAQEGICLGPAGPFPSQPPSDVLERRWLHYSFLPADGRLGMAANIAHLGPAAEDPLRRDRTTSIILLHETGVGWRTSQYNAAIAGPLWSAFRRPQGLGEPGQLELRSKSGNAGVSYAVHRTSHPCAFQCVSFAGDHHMRWQSETGLYARGDWCYGDRVYRDVEAFGYNERVRGRWGWPEIGGWIWGYTNDNAGAPGAAPPTAVVFSLIQPQAPPDAATGSVIVWRHGRVVRHFPRRLVTMAGRGRLDRDRGSQFPALGNLLGTGPTPPIPARLTVCGRMGADWVAIDFASMDAARVVVPCETSLDAYRVHEVIGRCEVEGRIGGKPIAFAAPAIVEFSGGAGGE